MKLQLEPNAFDILEVRIGALARDFLFRARSSDTGVIGQIFIDQSYDMGMLRRCDEIVDFVEQSRGGGKKPLIVDAGANIGASAVYFAGQCPDALVVAIEPEMGNFEILVANTKGLNVLPMRAALADRHDKVRIVDPGEGHWGYRTVSASDSSGDDTVDCITLDEIYDRFDKEYFPLIVKIDVEGGERDIFSRKTEWVERTPIIIVELHDWLLPKHQCALPFLRCIAKQNRDFVHIGEDIFSISNDLDKLVSG